MSATLSNTADLQAFLQAEVYLSDFRPVSFLALQQPESLYSEIWQITISLGIVYSHSTWNRFTWADHDLLDFTSEGSKPYTCIKHYISMF